MSDFDINNTNAIWAKDAIHTSTYVPQEFSDVSKVLEFGAKKYGEKNWLEPNSLNHRKNHESMSRHLAEYYMGTDKDYESGLDPLLHLACRALMAYTLAQRGIE